jgi:insertion element IS1 protein InsB
MPLISIAESAQNVSCRPPHLGNAGFTGKDLTFPIEQDNSDIRHHLARFRRRSRVTSRARHMVDGALRLLCHLRQPENFLPMRDCFLSIFG